MLYFSLWCIFLVCVILSVPLAAFYEKRKLPPLRPMGPEDNFGEPEEMGDAMVDAAGDEMAEVEPAGDDAFGGGDEAFGGGDDAFAEFDEEVK